MALPSIVLVTGPRDGAGKTTVAVTLACALSRAGRRTVLVDADDRCPGDAAHLLGIREAQSLATLDLRGGPAAVAARLSTHRASETAFVPATNLPGRPDRIHALAAALEGVCEVLLVDLGATVSPADRALLDLACLVLVVVRPDGLHLAHAGTFIRELAAADVSPTRIKVLLTGAPMAGAATGPASSLLGHPVAAQLASDAPAIDRARAEGRPLHEAAPGSVLLGQLIRMADQVVARGWLVPAPPRNAEAIVDPEARERWLEWRRAAHRGLVEEIDLPRLHAELSATPAHAPQLRARAEEAVRVVMERVAPELVDRVDRARMVREVVDEALGLGPLDPLLADPTVIEVMVNGRDDIWVERRLGAAGSRIERVDAAFADDAQLLGVIERIVARVGRRVDQRSPMVDARLADGSRVNAVVPPVAVRGPALTIRKASDRRITMADLVRFGSLDDEIAALLAALVVGHANLVISGGTTSGKTTLLNALAGFIPKHERVITVEDAAELRLDQPHVVSLESRPPDLAGAGEVRIRDLVRNALRMRPDRIIVGECRGGEALDMVQAMSTGHEGSMTTLHANRADDLPSRLEVLMMFAGLELPSRAIREQIASAVDIVIHQGRDSDGVRRITQIAEVTGVSDGGVQMRDIYAFHSRRGPDGRERGRLEPTGYLPAVLPRLVARGADFRGTAFGDALGSGS